MGHAVVASALVLLRRGRWQGWRAPSLVLVALLLGALGGGVAAARNTSEDASPPRSRATAGLVEEVSIALALAAPPAEPEEVADSAFSGRRPTPMTPRQAAEMLAWAWQEVTGRPAPANTVAVLWAHWALETARGERMVDHNFGGLKGRAPGGASSVVWTRESGKAGKTRVRARFRAYATAEDGARDYVRLLHARFNPAFVAASEGDAEGFVHALDDAGYFTEHPRVYGRAIRSLVREYLSELAG